MTEVHLRLILSFGEIRVYVLDDLLKRLGKDCERCVYGPVKRGFLNCDCCKCVEVAEKLIHSTVIDENYASNPEKLDKWFRGNSPP